MGEGGEGGPLKRAATIGERSADRRIGDVGRDETLLDCGKTRESVTDFLAEGGEFGCVDTDDFKRCVAHRLDNEGV